MVTRERQEPTRAGAHLWMADWYAIGGRGLNLRLSCLSPTTGSSGGKPVKQFLQVWASAAATTVAPSDLLSHDWIRMELYTTTTSGETILDLTRHTTSPIS